MLGRKKKEEKAEKKEECVLSDFGKYTVFKKIAFGGMAEILLATDMDSSGIGRFVVIKKALLQFSDDENFKKMFKTEGRIVCSLNHKNIVPIHDFGTNQEQHFLCMEYIAGGNLRELLRKIKSTKKTFPTKEKLYLIKEVASGLDYAHNAVDINTGEPFNLIHRDVSPQNIMIGFDGGIKLIDFGIAKIADTNLTQAGHLKGKFGYMSPEQTQGEVLDLRTDIFCLGIILWELLTNKRLFSFKTDILTLKKIRNCEIPDLKSINSEIPDCLVKITNKALEKNRNNRYSSMAEFEKDINNFLNKNFPTFSQYDYINFIKDVYSEEIVKHREWLNALSKKVRDYIKRKNSNQISSGGSLDIEDHQVNNSMIMSELDEDIDKVKNEKKIEKKIEKKALKETSNITETESFVDDDMMMEGSQTFEGKDSQILKKESSKKTFEIYSSPVIKQDQSYPNVTNINNLKLSSKSRTDHKIAKEEAKKLNELEDLQKDIVSDNPDFYLTNSKKKQSMDLSTDSFTLNTQKSNIPNNSQAKKKNPSSQRNFLVTIFGFAFLISVIGGLFFVFKNVNKIGKSNLLNNVVNSVQSKVNINNKSIRTTNSRSVANIGTRKKAVANKKIIILETNPSGANVFINNKKLSRKTPLRISINLNSSIKIELRKNGYKKKIVNRSSARSIPNRLSLSLEKERKSSSIKIHKEIVN